MSLMPEFRDQLWGRRLAYGVHQSPCGIAPSTAYSSLPVTPRTGAELMLTGVLSSLTGSPTPPPAPRAGAEPAHRPPPTPHSPHWRTTFWFSSAQMGGRLGLSEDRGAGPHRRWCLHPDLYLPAAAPVAPAVSLGRPAAAGDFKWEGWRSSHSPRGASHLQTHGAGSRCPQTLEAELRFLTRRQRSSEMRTPGRSDMRGPHGGSNRFP